MVISTKLLSGSRILPSKKPSPVVRGSLAMVYPSLRKRSINPITASLLPTEKENCANPICHTLSGSVIFIFRIISNAAPSSKRIK